MSISQKKQKEIEKTTAGDVAHYATKAVLSMIPVAGGPLVETFTFLVTDPIAKRRDAWINEIGERLIELEKKFERSDGKPLIESLKEDESFTTVLLTASQMAVRNHQKEKLDALRNAVLNAALGNAPDDTERAIFLQSVDRLTPAHMAILALMSNPRSNPKVVARFGNNSMGGITHLIFQAIPELSGHGELIKVLWKDLIDAGLLGEVGLNVTMSGHGLLEKRTTRLGDKFIDFITNPLDKN